MFKAYLEALAAWGPHPTEFPEPDDFQSYLEDLYVLRATAGGVYPARHLVMRYDPRLDVENKQLSFLPSAKGKRVSGKPGRMLRKMFPWFEDFQIEEIVTQMKNTFMVDTSGWALETTTDRIGDVYQMEQGENVPMTTSSDYKELCCSCMRYEFDGQEHHPCDAYNSGDWELYYVLNDDDELVARTLVHLKSRTRGPIYACSSPAAEYLKEHVSEFRKASKRGDDWDGARLLVLFAHGGDEELAAPYLDCCSNGFTYDPQVDHKYMVIGGDAVNVSSDEHEGTQNADICTCDHCGDRYNPCVDEATLQHCASCAVTMVTCEYSHRDVPEDELVTIERFHGGTLQVHEDYAVTFGDRVILSSEHYLFEERENAEA